MQHNNKKPDYFSSFFITCNVLQNHIIYRVSFLKVQCL